MSYKLAPRKIESLALKNFRTPRNHPRPPREERWLEGAQTLTLPYAPPAGADQDAPKTLAAWEWGDGATVLLIHGWEGRGSQMAAFAAPLADAGFRVVAVDMPAHGETGGSQSSLPELATAIQSAARALTETTGEPLHAVVAHSFGCAGTALALSQGMHAERVVFISTPEDFGRYLARTIHNLGLPETVYRKAARSIEERFGIDWERVRRITIDAACDMPLLVIQDRGDAETPFTSAQAVAQAWPHSRLLATDGLGHRRILRDPFVVREVCEFVSAASRSEQIAS